MTAAPILPVDTLVKRDRAVVVAAAAALTALAWTVLLGKHGTPRAQQVWAPHGEPLAVGSVALAISMWFAMMVAMMLPAVLPWLWWFAAANRTSNGRRAGSASTVSFAGGYFAVWMVYSVAAGVLQVSLHQTGLLHGDAARVGAVAGGLLLCVAGLFQFSPLKARCLTHCRSPLSFFLSHWQDGPVGAFRMGVRHGAFCLGCCWALMALSFALGVMNLLWMAGLTLMICVEKVAPGGARWSRGFGAVLVMWGIWLVAA